jgi:2-oxoglutarate ferredoxin oxidoreductase subunit gamma
LKSGMIISGYGGQGVLELANNLSYYQLLKGRHVAYTPSYGPETRGGKVKCFVVVSDEEIGSPMVEEPDFLIVMNRPSMDFVPLLCRGGSLLMNSSLIPEDPERRSDIRVFKIPATELADALRSEVGFKTMKDTKITANSVMFGAYLAVSGETLESVTTVRQVFTHFLIDRKAQYIPLNLEAVNKGFKFAERLLIAPSQS